MFDIGFTELMVIALVGLIVLGPKRLPEVARTVGQWVGKVRRFVADVKEDIDREMQHAELAELRNLKQELDETRRVMEETSSRLMQEATRAANEAESAAAALDAPPASSASPPAPAVETPPPAEPGRHGVAAAVPAVETDVAPKPAAEHREKAAPKQTHDRAE